MQRMGADVSSQVVGLGDTPRLERLIGAVKVMIDAFSEGHIDVLYLLYTKFVNAMKQEPLFEQLLPLTDQLLGEEAKSGSPWDYIYEPEAKSVVDAVLVRYVEALIYQAIVENFASEQSARMVAMKAASDNAATIIDELQLIYNKARQAAITKEISEIVGGAAAIAS
jgi:F-type H+-transporting ATPase subunit gamma